MIVRSLRIIEPESHAKKWCDPPNPGSFSGRFFHEIVRFFTTEFCPR
jgi:hypothetical protein